MHRSCCSPSPFMCSVKPLLLGRPTLLQGLVVGLVSLHYFKLELVLRGTCVSPSLRFTVQESEYRVTSGVQALLF